MQNYNHILVASAIAVSVIATLSEKLLARDGNTAVNNTIYGYSQSSGQCIVASSKPAVGCKVSSVGSTCIVFIVENGFEHEADAYKSPVSSAFCLLSLRRSQ